MWDKKEVIDIGNRVMKKLFGLEPGWHRQLDIVKNNHTLGRFYMAQGNYKDALFRLKFLVWLDPQHQAGWLDLARSELALGHKLAAARALKKLLVLDPHHPEALQLKAQMAAGTTTISSTLEITPEMDAKPLYAIHKACFPIYWKEAEISDMLMTSGTKAWLARADLPVGMLITRAQFEQAEILTIGVVPKSQKTGIANRLLDAAEKSLAQHGVKKIFLEVAENNAAALALYQKRRYTEISRRKGYYKQPDGSVIDALVLAKEL